MRFKKTEVCQTCSKSKNVYQTCLLDLEYGLPIQVCDVGLYFKDDMPKSDVNKEYYTQNMETEISRGEDHHDIWESSKSFKGSHTVGDSWQALCDGYCTWERGV